MIEELSEKVYKKINKEYNSYLEDIKKLSSDEIIKSAYEITVKQELVEMFCHEENKYKLMVLLEKDNALEFLYNSWMETDGGLHNIVEEKLAPIFYDMTIDCKKNILEKIKKNSNYELICDISDTLQAFDTSDFCYHIKDKFDIDNLDIYDVYSMLQTKEDINFLIDYFKGMKANEHLSYCIEIGVIDYQSYNRIDEKLLPGLLKLKKEQLKVNNNKTIIDRGR